MPWAAIIPAVAALAGGAMSANAAGNAADASATASRNAAALQAQQYAQTRADLSAQRESQRYAIDAMLSMTGLPALRGDPSATMAPTAPQGISRRPVPRPSIGNPAFGSSYGGTTSPFNSIGLDGFGSLGGLEGLTFQNIPSLQDLLSHRRPEARMVGGPIQEGNQYNVSEIGHPEGIYDSGGNLQNITTTPQTITAQQDGYVAPLPTGPTPMGFGDILDPIGITHGGDLAGPLGATGDPLNLFGGGGGGGGTASTYTPAAVQYPQYPGIPPDYYQTTGAAIPGSSVTENPGGQAGRYSFMADPGYQFRFDEGQRAIERSASARGMELSGSILRELTRYGQGMGSAEYGNVYNRLSNIAGLGQVGQHLTAQAGMNSATQQGGYLQNIGNAAGAADIGRASAYGDTLTQLARIYGQYANGTP